MEREIQDGDVVLLVCTENYLRRVEEREQPGKGLGVVWESDVIYNLLYDHNSDVQTWRPCAASERSRNYSSLAHN
jgi:hypothetical protein